MQRFTSYFALRSAAFCTLASGIVFLSGCSNMTGTAPPTSFDAAVVTGSLYGGQQPIAAAHVYMYAANATGGYGSASTSLLVAGTGGATADGNGHAFVTTDPNGNFSYTGTFPCTPGNQIYLLGLGGNPKGTPTGPQNGAIALSAALGNCTTVGPSTVTNINEVTTVAMAYALNAFMVDSTHVGAPASNAAGLNAAFATVKNLVNSTFGTALLTTPAGNGAVPQQYLNTLANIIASCVNSGSGTSAACTQLFTNATVTTSPTPQDTVGAMINIAAFPAAQTANLYAISSTQAPFQPALAAQPNDFALGITYTPGVSVVRPGPVVIDTNGNIWMSNCQSCTAATATDSIIEYDRNGTYLHSYSNAGIHNTQGLAIDASGTYIYSLNQAVAGSTHTQDQMTKMLLTSGALQAGFPVSFDPATYGTNTFFGIAIDNAGQIWATALNTGAVVEMIPAGNLINGSPFFIGGTNGVGVDNIGNIWFAGQGGNNLAEFDTNGDFLQNFTPSGLNQPLSMAINRSNELLTINIGSKSLSKIESSDGSNGSGSPYTNLGLNQASVTAIDGTNQIVIPNCRASCPGSGSALPDNLLRLTPSGAPDTGASGTDSGVRVAGFSGVGGAAIDASGNVWVSNSVTGKLTQVIGFAAPTIQPLAAASSTAKIGQRP